MNRRLWFTGYIYRLSIKQESRWVFMTRDPSHNSRLSFMFNISAANGNWPYQPDLLADAAGIQMQHKQHRVSCHCFDHTIVNKLCGRWRLHLLDLSPVAQHEHCRVLHRRICHIYPLQSVCHLYFPFPFSILVLEFIWLDLNQLQVGGVWFVTRNIVEWEPLRWHLDSNQL